MFSPFLYVPYYFVAIYAFIAEKDWIRIPTLMWGYGLLLTMVVVLREELFGAYPTKDVKLFLMGYGPYALMPIIIMARVARYPVFSKAQSTTEVTEQTDAKSNAGGMPKKKKQKKT